MWDREVEDLRLDWDEFSKYILVKKKDRHRNRIPGTEKDDRFTILKYCQQEMYKLSRVPVVLDTGKIFTMNTDL